MIVNVCFNCGTALPQFKNERFCQTCGNKLSRVSIVSDEKGVNAEVVPDPSSNSRDGAFRKPDGSEEPSQQTEEEELDPDLEPVAMTIGELRDFEKSLRAEFKPLANDLARGVKAYYALAIMSAVMMGMTLWLALLFLLPQYYAYNLGNPYFGAVLLAYPALGGVITYKAYRRYYSLTNKYSSLIELSQKLGD